MNIKQLFIILAVNIWVNSFIKKSIWSIYDNLNSKNNSSLKDENKLIEYSLAFKNDDLDHVKAESSLWSYNSQEFEWSAMFIKCTKHALIMLFTTK